MPFSGGLWDEGFNWDRLRRFIAGYQPLDKQREALKMAVEILRLRSGATPE
jgi:hypothetical protein